jgi:hypothetical protein
MSDLTPPDPHAPAANDASHSSGIEAMKHHGTTCGECGGSPKCEWKILPNGIAICPNCQKNKLTAKGAK